MSFGSKTSKRAAAQSVKLVRNALVVCCVERGTVYSRVARRHEVAQRRYTLWPDATCRLPQVGPDQRLWAVRKCLFDHHNHHCRGLLAVDSEAAPQNRIHTDPSASVHAVGLVRTGHEEDQPNARVFNQISETINQIIATTVWDEEGPTVIRNLHEPSQVALRRTVEAFSAAGGENQKRRGGNKCAANCVDVVKPFLEDPLRRLCVMRCQIVDVFFEVVLEISHRDAPSACAPSPPSADEPNHRLRIWLRFTV